MKIPRYRDIIPPVEEAYLSIDGAMVAIASVVVALLQRTWPDDDKRELELERMRTRTRRSGRRSTCFARSRLSRMAATATATRPMALIHKYYSKMSANCRGTKNR